MRLEVTFFTDIEDHALIYNHLSLIGGYDVEIDEVPDAPSTPQGAPKIPNIVDRADEEE